MRNKLFGAEFITPLNNTEASYPDHKGAILADLLEDELDAMGEWEMKVKLKEYMWEEYAKFDDESLDEMWQMLAHQWGLELKWSKKQEEPEMSGTMKDEIRYPRDKETETERTVRNMVEFVEDERDENNLPPAR